jgi:hypothetical protein
MWAPLRIEAVHHDLVEVRTITTGHDLYHCEAVALEKTLRKLCCIGAQKSRRRLLGHDMIDAMPKQRATDAVSMLVREHHAPTQRCDAGLGMIKRNSATAHNDPVIYRDPKESDPSVEKSDKVRLVGCDEVGRHVAPEYFQAWFTIRASVRSYPHR